VVFRLLFALLLSLPAGATVFQMQSMDEQISDADGIIMGHYLRSKSVQLEDGSLATQMIFKMNKEVGMQSELFGLDEIIIHYPGGTMGDQTVKVEGVPNFISGEKVVIMVKSSHDRFWGMNLGFGTFKVINYGKERMVVNTLFPNDRRVGQVNLEQFEKNVKRIKGSGLKVVRAPEYPTEKHAVERLPASEIEEEGKNRAIASIDEAEENITGRPVFNTAWLVFILAILGGLFRLNRQKDN